MGIKFTSSFDGDKLFKTIREAEETAMGESLEHGVGLIEEKIRTRPSAKSGKQGRIETGAYLESFDYRVGDSSGNTGGEIVQKDFQDYYEYQESGFTHAGSGEFIQGTQAILDSIPQIEKLLNENIRKRMGKVTD